MFKNYTICGQKIRVEMPCFPNDSADWRLFETNETKPDITVSCKISEKFPDCLGAFRGRSGDFEVFSLDEKVYRKRQMGKADGSLAEYDYRIGDRCQVLFTPESFPVLTDERYFWGSIPLAQLLLPKKAALMHASYIDVGGSAVLFSAPCGTGKSTQAELWRVHRNAEVINGDKAGVFFKEGNAFAGGLPFCGTSGICKNKNLPLKAIVLLGQSKKNRVKHLTGFEALQGVINNMYLDLSAPLERQMCIDFVIELLGKVPVLSLECTPDERAVKSLETILP